MSEKKFEKYLNQKEIHELYDAVSNSELINNYDALLSGLRNSFKASLSMASVTTAKLLKDLETLNTTENLVDGSIPLKVWLENAERLSSPLNKSQVFEEKLKKLFPQKHQPKPTPNEPQKAREASLNRDDELGGEEHVTPDDEEDLPLWVLYAVSVLLLLSFVLYSYLSR